MAPISALLLTLSVVTSSPAPPQVGLDYLRGSGAEACPDDEVLRDAVSARLGYVPWHPQAPRQVVVRVERRAGLLRARVELADPSAEVVGRRDLSSPDSDCRELAEAMALAIAIAVDPLTLTRPAPQSSSPPSATDPPNPAAATTTTPEPHPPPPQEGLERAATEETFGPIELQFGAGILAALAAAPGPTAGATLSAGLGWRFLSLSLEGRADLPADAVVGNSARVSSHLLVGTLAPCAHYGWVGACLLATGGALRGAGHGMEDARYVTTPYAALGGRLALTIPAGDLVFFRGHLDLSAPLTRISLADAATDEIYWTTPALSGALGGMVGVHF